MEQDGASLHDGQKEEENNDPRIALTGGEERTKVRAENEEGPFNFVSTGSNGVMSRHVDTYAQMLIFLARS
jgi:hypothetical protein